MNKTAASILSLPLIAVLALSCAHIRSVPRGSCPVSSCWTNHLGMVFVPVPQTQAAFSIYETRVSDFAAFAATHPRLDGTDWNHALYHKVTPVSVGSDYPVVAVSWNDANAFCHWLTQTERDQGLIPPGAVYRLPTDAEWEYAARGGLEQKIYSWGDKLRPQGKHMCNIWQGEFPNHDSGDDGYAGTCPVNAFPPNDYGLHSMTENTWEWCADWFSPDFHLTADRDNPSGPPHGSSRVTKGGSFLCHKSYCNRYRVASRSSNTPDSSSSNVSFRCVLSD